MYRPAECLHCRCADDALYLACCEWESAVSTVEYVRGFRFNENALDVWVVHFQGF